MKFYRPVCCLIALVLAVTVSGQTTKPFSNDAGFSLVVGGEVERPLKLTLSDLRQMPRRSLRATPHNGKESSYDGVPVHEILKKAGVKFGEELKGKALATYLLVEATDAYQAVFALPELDPAFTDREVLLADRQDGEALAVQSGPLQIIVPHEKRHARWVRQVKSLMIYRSK